MANLIALADFPYAGKAIKAGDTFEAASDQDARTLVLIGKARRETLQLQRRDLNADPVATPVTDKRRYKHRKLTAEP